ncbi:MAG TPA: acyl carrier protein [Acidobacteriaceae bacterium]
MPIKPQIRAYIAENFLHGSPAADFTDATPLITSGIVDSLGMISLVDFLESNFGIEFLPREIDVDSLDTIEHIDAVVRAKLVDLQSVDLRHGQ